jgi:hypothetical protein
MQGLRESLTASNDVHIVSFGTRPGKLFEGAEQRLTIYIQGARTRSPRLFSGGYLKWNQEERESLFQSIGFDQVSNLVNRRSIWPKTRGSIEHTLMNQLLAYPSLVSSGALNGNGKLYYKNTGLRYFSTVTRKPPLCTINGVPSSSSRETTLSVDPQLQNQIHCLLLSSTFYCLWQWMSNGRDLNPADIDLIPTPKLNDSRLVTLSAAVEKDYESKARTLVMNNKKTGRVELQSLSPAKSKLIIDRIDTVLTELFGLSQLQTDLIINYDIKYRMGQSADDDSDCNPHVFPYQLKVEGIGK